MNRDDLIQSFRDTMALSESKELKERTAQLIRDSRIVMEMWRKGIINKPASGEAGDVIVEENTSFAAAKKYLPFGKVAVLNFANPENPGGGVTNGAMAQEECLCRSSNLYCALSDKSVSEYYLYHRALHSIYYSDRLIYSPGVTVFKDDKPVPELLPESEWFQTDVITCAAPYLRNQKTIDEHRLSDVFKSRIKNIFEAAIRNDVDVLILGAFGCGAFKNPPALVARAFREVIEENRYTGFFKKIVFAIKRSTDTVCPNLTAFTNELNGLKLAIQPIIVSQTVNNTHKELKNKADYAGKKFSILGDSISTLAGYNPDGYKPDCGADQGQKGCGAGDDGSRRPNR